MPRGRPKVPGCAECKHKKRRCTHVAQSPPPAEPELTSPPRESCAPERFDDDQRYRTARTGRRALDGKRRPSPSRTTPSKCARTESPVPRTNTPRPVLQATPTGANLSTPDITGSWILADITAKHIVRIADITGGYNWCLFLWHCPV
jgi:hypothetical protein